MVGPKRREGFIRVWRPVTEGVEPRIITGAWQAWNDQTRLSHSSDLLDLDPMYLYFLA